MKERTSTQERRQERIKLREENNNKRFTAAAVEITSLISAVGGAYLLKNLTPAQRETMIHGITIFVMLASASAIREVQLSRKKI